MGEELTAQRAQFTGLCDKAAFKAVQVEIKDVAHRLKVSNQTLCRNLKENPNVQANMDKMAREHADMVQWFEDTKNDLLDNSFASLVAKVETGKRKQEELNVMRVKDRAAAEAVAQRTIERNLLAAENEKEKMNASIEIKELKEHLQKSKTISEIEFKFEEKRLRASQEAIHRIHAQMIKKLNEEKDELERRLAMEETVHKGTMSHMEDTVLELQQQREQRQADFQADMIDAEMETCRIKDKQHIDLQELLELDDKRRAESLDHKSKEDQMRHAVLVEKQRRDQLQRMTDAVLFLQSEGRRYIADLQTRSVSKKAKKKNKRGSKKR